nr:hypothetical protein [uncultured Desulfobulbus sp.]
MADKTKPFEIGLVGAGAISAGAYTGGVIDFMIQALDSWYKAKATDPTVPPHDVTLSAFSGASAGGMTAAIAAGFLGSDQPPIIDEQTATEKKSQNKLYHSWVERIDISSLLESNDLNDADAMVQSLLDSSILRDIAHEALNLTPRAERRPYVAERFQVMVTVTNLRGVPYSFPMQGDQRTDYDMSLHADYMHFEFSDQGQASSPDRYGVSWKVLGQQSPLKEKIELSALASGAFPVGLAPRTLDHLITPDPEGGIYDARRWRVPTPYHQGTNPCMTLAKIPPHWPNLEGNLRYDFQCLDGGVMNNEPFELARQALAGQDGINERDGAKADKAVLLIDPFPNVSTFTLEEEPATDIVKLIIRLFAALKNQARFKPDELKLADDRNVSSRFMIAPSRPIATDRKAEYPIACGSLGGFGGFLKRDFRNHDFFLGRRNAQKFFRDHFVLPEDNPLFVDWGGDDPELRVRMIEVYCVKDPQGRPQLVDGKHQLPIIPLVGVVQDQECRLLPWPRYSEKDMERFMDQVERRTDKVLGRLAEQYFKGWKQWLAKLVIKTKKNDIKAFVEQSVYCDLQQMGLIRGWSKSTIKCGKKRAD